VNTTSAVLATADRTDGARASVLRMPTDQRVEQTWETPAPDEIVSISHGHVEAMESSDDDMIWSPGGMHHVVLRTIGRKSGNEHKVALPMWRDADGHPLVVASFGGSAKHPAWFLNLQDTSVNAEVLCRVQGGAYWSTPEILDGDDYDTNWAALLEDRAWYADYQARTERRIPLVRLPETRPA
jgi:deazaflavin-dependent oxidoreductase (nitroreductase family)